MDQHPRRMSKDTFRDFGTKIHHNSIWYKIVFDRQYLSSFTDNEAPGQFFPSPLQFQITSQPLTMTWQKTTSDMPLAYHVAAVFQQQPSLIPPLSQYKILNCLLVNYLSSLLCLVSGKLYVWYTMKKKVSGKMISIAMHCLTALHGIIYVCNKLCKSVLLWTNEMVKVEWDRWKRIKKGILNGNSLLWMSLWLFMLT